MSGSQKSTIVRTTQAARLLGLRAVDRGAPSVAGRVPPDDYPPPASPIAPARSLVGSIVFRSRGREIRCANPPSE